MELPKGRKGCLIGLRIASSLLGTVLELSSATLSSKVYHCILYVSLYVIHVILFVWYVYNIGLPERLRI